MTKYLSTLAIAALIFAGCASDDDTAPTATEPSTSVAPTTTTTTIAAPTTVASAAPTSSAPTTTITLPSPEGSDILAIAAGVRHTCALSASGSISCWGDNENGQLGNGESGSKVYSTVPVGVQDITDAVAIGAGWEHTCAVHATGEVSCWGDNSRGELGNGETAGFAALPAKAADISDAVSVTAGNWHTCALRQAGNISCWGADQDGQLGNGQIGDEDDSAVPVEVTGISDAVAVSAGGEHTCALHSTGEISCWGDNWSGELGNGQAGNEFDSSVPVKVSGIDDAMAVSSGDWHTCAVHEDATVSCWGNGWYGELGSLVSTVNSYSPFPLKIQGFFDVVAVEAGSGHTCAVRDDGSVFCWGLNLYGQLGSSPFENTLSGMPIAVQSIDDATALAAGSGHSCAIRESGGVVCWGANFHGQLGHNQNSGLTYDKARVAGIDDAIAISSADHHSCVTHATGEVSCWGSDWKDGSLTTIETLEDSILPLKVEGLETAVGISSDIGLNCATLEGGEASCWGFYWSTDLTTLDDGNTSPVPRMWEDASNISRIEVGGSHACALHDDSTITCAGANWYGNLGNGRFGTLTSWAPEQVVDIDDAVDVSLGFAHTCAVHATGEVSCWGRNDHGQLGNGAEGSENNSASPVKVLGITDAVSISAGYSSLNCVLHATGEVSCWGTNIAGELGSDADREGTRSSTDHSSVPVKISGITDVAAVSAGNHHACVLHKSGEVSCWGSNGFGELGTGGHLADDQTATPQKVEGVTDATAISAGFLHTCALRENGEVICWGWDEHGQLGDGQAWTRTNSHTPVEVVGL